MDKKFNSRLRMFDSSDEVLMANDMSWVSFAPMVDAIGIFRGQRDAINVTKQQQQMNLKPIAENKLAKRDLMAGFAMNVCDKTRAWCKAMGDIIGYGQLHITHTMIINGRGSDAQTLCETIYEKANTMTSAERTTYRLTAVNMSELLDSITAYSAVKVSPRTAVAMRKTDTDSFKKLFTDCTLTLKTSIDHLMVEFKGTKFYEDYFNARRIVQDATQKANLAVTVLSDYDGSPLAGALVHGTDGVSTFEEMADSKGRVRRSEIHSDLWELTITHANYVGTTVSADIYPGDKEKVLVKLKPI